MTKPLMANSVPTITELGKKLQICIEFLLLKAAKLVSFNLARKMHTHLNNFKVICTLDFITKTFSFISWPVELLNIDYTFFFFD